MIRTGAPESRSACGRQPAPGPSESLNPARRLAAVNAPLRAQANPPPRFCLRSTLHIRRWEGERSREPWASQLWA